MRKLRLNPEDLQVESFRSDERVERKGTVAAYSGSDPACGSAQTTVNDVECWKLSVYVACPEELSPP